MRNLHNLCQRAQDRIKQFKTKQGGSNMRWSPKERNNDRERRSERLTRNKALRHSGSKKSGWRIFSCAPRIAGRGISKNIQWKKRSWIRLIWLIGSYLPGASVGLLTEACLSLLVLPSAFCQNLSCMFLKESNHTAKVLCFVILTHYFVMFRLWKPDMLQAALHNNWH